MSGRHERGSDVARVDNCEQSVEVAMRASSTGMADMADDCPMTKRQRVVIT